MKRSKHNLSHFRNTSFDMGTLTPIACFDTIQGDTIKQKTDLLLRTSSLVYPIMHPVYSYVSHYSVPIRLLWDKWEDFITGGEDFDDASVVPTITFDGAGSNPSPVTAGSLANHLGLPVGFSGTVNAFKFRAYAYIYNERIRDDQLQAEVGFSTDSGTDTTTNTDLLNANWGSDMFTKARPDEQLGTEVTLPLSGSAPVTGIGWETSQNPSGGARTLKEADGGTQAYTNTLSSSQTHFIAADGSDYPEINADLSSATASTLNELRLAIATQQWQEFINMSGNKYQDYLRRYGINYSDARINRPEFLGSSKKVLQFSEVIATAEGTSTNVGDLAGHGIAAMRSNEYMKFFEEASIVISMCCVKPIPMYMEGVARDWTKSTKEEFYQKEYEILGWQEIPNKEVQFNHSSPDGTFGYCPRFEEYRRIPNTVHGEYATTLKERHMARFFDAGGSGGDVALNSSFVTCNPTDRIYQDSGEDHIKATVNHKIAARRIVSKKHKPSGLSI